MILRLGAHNLSPSEVNLVKAFLRFFSHDPQFSWVFVEEGPYHALLVDIDAAPGVTFGMERGQAPRVLRITSQKGVEQGDVLVRPFRSDRLEAWLSMVQYERGERASPPVTPVAVDAPPATGVAAKPLADTGTDKDRQLRYKLTRWPPAVLLRKEPHRIRLATMLFKRFLSLEEMVRLSHWTAENCAGFVALLKTAGLLEFQAMAVQVAPAAVNPPEKPSKEKQVNEGFIGIFRRKLGL